MIMRVHDPPGCPTAAERRKRAIAEKAAAAKKSDCKDRIFTGSKNSRSMLDVPGRTSLFSQRREDLAPATDGNFRLLRDGAASTFRSFLGIHLFRITSHLLVARSVHSPLFVLDVCLLVGRLCAHALEDAHHALLLRIDARLHLQPAQRDGNASLFRIRLFLVQSCRLVQKIAEMEERS